MRSVFIVMGIVIATGRGWAGERTVTACLGRNAQVGALLQSLAEGYATRLYKNIGVDLRWKHGCTAAESDAPGKPLSRNLTAIGMEWALHAPADIGSGVYALARPFQPAGTRITLFVDRLAPVLEQPSLGAAVLGHVLAHEIGHVLLGYDGHAKEGVMKARWSAAEHARMTRDLMPFTLDVADIIRQSLDRRPTLVSSVADDRNSCRKIKTIYFEK